MGVGSLKCLCGEEKFAVLQIWGSILNTVNEIGDYEKCSIPPSFNQLQKSYIAVVSSRSQSHSLISHTHTHSSYPAPSVWLCVIAAQPAWLDTRRPHHRLAQLNRSPSCAHLIVGLPSESNVPNLVHTNNTVRDIHTHIAIRDRASFEIQFYVH